MFLVDLDYLSNGQGKSVYGDKLDAYSFFDTTCENWFNSFSCEVLNAIGKKYYPVYRIADGELRFLFGYKINWKRNKIISILNYIRYEFLKLQWETSWGEKYSSKDTEKLRKILQTCILNISKNGKLAIYWNQNGLNAYTEYNETLIKSFSKINININQDSYIPFHFGQALIAKNAKKVLLDKNVLFVSGIQEDEYNKLKLKMLSFGSKSVTLHRCSSTSALTDNYSNIKLLIKPDIIFVAAGIGSAKVLSELHYLECPVIDIGSYIHVLSGKYPNAHEGFFICP